MKLVIGLTGGIGSGKTTVANMFAAYGINIVDMDVIAHAIVEPGQPALQEIVSAFGAEVLGRDGSLNRQHLRKLVFADPAKRKQLEGILHPRIRAEARHQVDKATSPYCMMVIPLLFETGQNDLIQRILVVDTTPDLQLQRTMQRDNANREDVEKIIRVQVDRNARLAGADDIIENLGDEAALLAGVEALHQKYLSLAER
ncbi:MAG: dephospho-CoA kinase [Gammaproteobacteria bacterium]|nr:dephospho-CoA kinase [Gammaproteobacteria bacterium]MDH5651502.1 dephospho-CoA kinase [Gammaproteobacteria bacterium]